MALMKIRVQDPRFPILEIECEPDECARLLHALGAGTEPVLTVSRARPSTGNAPRKNRRGMVLATLYKLRDEGRDSPTLDDIRDRFHRLFPDEKMTHLDQVVRDLANKTDHLERLEWGTFKLAEKNS